METTATLVADLVPKLIKEKLLSIAEKQTVFYELGDKETLPEGEGKTIQFNRYERLPLPNAPLSEGVTPTETPLTLSSVQAVVDQWGATVNLTDVAVLTVRHPVLRVAQDRLGTQHAELVDREIQIVLMGSNNVTFGGTATSEATLVPGDVVTTDLIRRVLATLRQDGARTREGGLFTGVHDPFVEMDLSKDATFVTAASYASGQRPLMNGETGTWMGVIWKRSNLIPIVALLDPATYAISATDVGAPVAGEVNFVATSSVLVVISSLDRQTGFETAVSAVTAVTNAASFSVTAQIASTAPTGPYKVYVSLENGAVATLQAIVNHVVGTADTLVYVKAGTPSAAGRFIAQATGAVAPPEPPPTGGVHTTYIFGQESFGVTDLAGLETTLTPSVASDSDPLKQRRKAGWKQLFKPVIKNTSYYSILKTLSAFD